MNDVLQGRPRWTAGRVIAVVAGSVLLLISFGLIAGGVVLAVAAAERGDDGYLMTDETTISAPGHAITTETFTVETDAGVDVPGRLVGETKLVVTSTEEGPLFVGLAPSTEVDAFLAGVGHSTIDGFEGRRPTYDVVDGGSPATLPSDVGFWTASTSGTGTRTLIWEVESGDWTLVVMNADGHAPVNAEAAVGATLPALGATIGALLVSGGVLLLVALALLIGGLVSASRAGPRAPVPSR
ncbi:hypothetical protein SAMN05428985_102526 [Nocardioides sp. YR527]|uniref:hypothetical protein n=1 Tax=Nocardioides sp. YR527 TaxID=1881028 RepID=UPI000890F110|nr:hypothetical protein [Nocardioides sp. YR527]SDK06962.1 hypothetical protein SAMN05428985_102526 [Nocardioides sp. YR527]